MQDELGWWCFQTAFQPETSGCNLTILQGFLGSAEVKAALNQTASALAAITVLKKICDHPALLNKRNTLKAVRMPPKQLMGGKRGKGATKSKSQKPPHQLVNVLLSGDSDDDFAQPTNPRAARRPEQSDSEDDSEEDDSSSLGDFVVDDSDDESASQGESAADRGDEEGSAAEDEGEEAHGKEQSDGDRPGAVAEGGTGIWSSQQSNHLMKRLQDTHVEDSCKTVCSILRCTVVPDVSIVRQNLVHFLIGYNFGFQVFTIKLVRQLAATGHRTLVFSQSLGMLDMLQRALRRYAHCPYSVELVAWKIACFCSRCTYTCPSTMNKPKLVC